MTRIAIVYSSGNGHTRLVAEHVIKGADVVPDVEAERIEITAAGIGPDGRWNDPSVMATLGGSRIELQEFEPAGPVEERALPGSGLNHLSFGVEDIHAEYERLTAAGVEFIGEPIALDFGPDDGLTGWSVVYLRVRGA